MANYHELDIQNLARKMINGDIDAKKQIIEYYIKYINRIIDSNFNDFENEKIRIKNELIKIMYESINNYKKDQNEYLSHYITKKIIQHYTCELRKLNNKKEYKNREIQQLAIKMINGDIEALNKIIEFYTFHTRKLVNEKYNTIGYEEEDLVQIGIIGLLKAIDLYKLKQDHPFCMYASTYINNQIESEIRLINKSPQIEYIGLTNNYNNKVINDFVENAEVKQAINNLCDIQKKVIILYTYGKYSFEDIGKILGFTCQSAQLHYKNSIELIKQELNLPNKKQKKL